MITIITGIPGMGKTALTVQMMMEEEARGHKTGDHREFFVMGIPDLKIEHQVTPPVSEWTEERVSPEDPTLTLHYFKFPKNSIVIIDEAQRVFRTRSAGSKVPAIVAAFETHRHTGVDFWLMTQKPSLIDSNIRELCGRHIHIKPTITGRKLFEWPEYNDVNSKQARDTAAKRRFAPPKAAFDKYKSTELHTKQKFRLHNVWVVLLLSSFALAFFGYRTFNNIYSHIHPDQQKFIEATGQPKPGMLDKMNDPEKTITEKIAETAKTAIAPIPEHVHPYMGYKFIIRGIMETAKGGRVAYFDLVAPDGLTTFLSSKDLIELGYHVKIATACSAFLFFDGTGIVATCSPLGNGADGAHAREGRSIASVTSS